MPTVKIVLPNGDKRIEQYRTQSHVVAQKSLATVMAAIDTFCDDIKGVASKKQRATIDEASLVPRAALSSLVLSKLWGSLEYGSDGKPLECIGEPWDVKLIEKKQNNMESDCPDEEDEPS